MTTPHELNRTLLDIEHYATKAISLRAKRDPSIVNLGIGEPAFGPPPLNLEAIAAEDLSRSAFLDAAKRYEEPRGDPALRRAIADWYRSRYGLAVDPETEILITHGGVEAITLAVLSTTDAGGIVAVSDPSYMLYARAIKLLGRVPHAVTRQAGALEYIDMLSQGGGLGGARAFIVNSPENPTGYVISRTEWEKLGEVAQSSGVWVIHDEVYDVMAFERPHHPAWTVPSLAPSSIMINSFSKKFGVPGLRIGWMVAPRRIIDIAVKAHDYLYLGVNIQYERIGLRILSDERNAEWLVHMGKELHRRSQVAVAQLGDEQGYAWPRRPLGAMFLFPEVSRLYEAIPESYRAENVAVGDAVARYLLEDRKVVVVPGSLYGKQGARHIRLVLCSQQEDFDRALVRMR